jgi:hypothetical protein
LFLETLAWAFDAFAIAVDAFAFAVAALFGSSRVSFLNYIHRRPFCCIPRRPFGTVIGQMSSDGQAHFSHKISTVDHDFSQTVTKKDFCQRIPINVGKFFFVAFAKRAISHGCGLAAYLTCHFQQCLLENVNLIASSAEGVVRALGLLEFVLAGNLCKPLASIDDKV